MSIKYTTKEEVMAKNAKQKTVEKAQEEHKPGSNGSDNICYSVLDGDELMQRKYGTLDALVEDWNDSDCDSLEVVVFRASEILTVTPARGYSITAVKPI